MSTLSNTFGSTVNATTAHARAPTQARLATARLGTTAESSGMHENRAMGGPASAPNHALPATPLAKSRRPKAIPAPLSTMVRSRRRTTCGSGTSRMARITFNRPTRMLVAQTVISEITRPMRSPSTSACGVTAKRSWMRKRSS